MAKQIDDGGPMAPQTVSQIERALSPMSKKPVPHAGCTYRAAAAMVIMARLQAEYHESQKPLAMVADEAVRGADALIARLKQDQ